MKISFQTLHQWLVSAQCECVCVCLEDNFISTSAFIHKQKDHTVLKLSSVLHGCLHQLIKNQKVNVDLRNKTSTKESERPFFLLLFVFFVCIGPGAWYFCAVTWLHCDRHLKRWHSAGPITTVTHDKECMQGLWSVEPPLSANTRWSTEPPWIL